MMTIARSLTLADRLLKGLRSRGIELDIKGGRIIARGPVTAADREAVAEARPGLTVLLGFDGDLVDPRRVDRARKSVERQDDRPTLGQVAVWRGDLAQADLDDLVGDRGAGGES